MSEAESERLLQWLRRARRVIAFCGAGVSAESGVPTFRSAGGLWENFSIEDVATPTGFSRNPLNVWRFYGARIEQLATVAPNAAHVALAEMERHFPRFLLVTQNVDDLHERAGSVDALHIHGALRETRCLGCDAVAATTSRHLDAVARAELPMCDDCGRILRPNVVWFGEPLNPDDFRRIEEFVVDASPEEEPLLLVIGTSGEVGGGYGILEFASLHRFRVVEINPERTLLTGLADLVVRARAAEALGSLWPRVGVSSPDGCDVEAANGGANPPAEP